MHTRRNLAPETDDLVHVKLLQIVLRSLTDCERASWLVEHAPGITASSMDSYPVFMMESSADEIGKSVVSN